MTKYSSFLPALALLVLAVSFAAHGTPVPAPGPEGDWLVADGSAQIRIVHCGDGLVGAISWEKTPGLDENNPDESKRKLPALGLPILRNLHPESDTQWSGEIYNADNGKIYHGGIALNDAKTLHIKGCLLNGVLCGGEDWTRASAKPAKGLDTASICKRAAAD